MAGSATNSFRFHTAFKIEWQGNPMKRRFMQWGLCSGIAAVVSLVGLLLFDRVVISILEPLLGPWIRLCQAITPDSWEVQGNILLGLTWMISGLLVTCMLIGAIATLLLSAFEKRRGESANRPTSPLSSSREPFWIGAAGNEGHKGIRPGRLETF